MKTLLLSLALPVLAGCNFEAPLTEKPIRKVDPALLGSWFSLTDGRPLDVFKLSKEEYLVVDDGSPYVRTHSACRSHRSQCRNICYDLVVQERLYAAIPEARAQRVIAT